jgi:hypothetical protein
MTRLESLLAALVIGFLLTGVLWNACDIDNLENRITTLETIRIEAPRDSD